MGQKQSAPAAPPSRKKAQATVAIIGGSGLYKMDGLKDVREVAVATPFGKPSSQIVLGELEGVPVAFLARHGLGHTLLPSEINYCANLFALKKIGVERVLSVSAVGIMQPQIAPGHLVLPDQFYDLTRGRKNTFFGRGIVAHAGMADPVCAELAGIVAGAAEAVGATVHRGGTYLCIEGPQFSTRSESHIHRSWGGGDRVSVIGMTNATEAKLAREAELCYTTLALATDYDCWHTAEADVTVEAVLKVLHDNIQMAQRVIRTAVGALLSARTCGCVNAMRNAIVTSPERVPKKIKTDLGPIIGKYLGD